MRFLILCSYFQRPRLVRNALQSILASNEYHSDWELAFGDDGSPIPGKPIVEEILKDHLSKLAFFHSGMDFEDKVRWGIRLGRMANEAIQQSSADAAIILSDDDELHPLYLKQLSAYFEQNPETLCCYSLVHLFNPLKQRTPVDNLHHKYNQWNGPINPVSKVDASQVAWRLACCKERGAWFQDSTKFVPGKPWTKDTDKSFFENLYDRCGDCQPTGIVAQYKGIHDYQLLWHKNVGPDQLKVYYDTCCRLGGVEF
jgi:hypothetical protein